MFKPLALCIGLRYTRSKRGNRFISFISLSSMLGIALGVTVLITVLSVMNGFDEEIHNRFFGMAPQITLSTFDGKLANWPQVMQQTKQFSGIKGAAPYVGGQALLSVDGQNVPAIISGIIPEQEAKINNLAQNMKQGKLANLTQGKYGIILGMTLARQLGAQVGDKITVMIPQASISPIGIQPRFKRFTLTGVFSAGGGFGFDNRLAYINLSDAQKLFLMGNKISGLHLTINDIYQAPVISERLEMRLGDNITATSWTEQFGPFFKAVKMEKTMMFIILLLIVAVAAFNLISSLVMIVSDKQSDIAILRTFGALPKTILMIFIVQGSLVGIFGTLLGTIGGIALALNATDIVSWMQQAFNVQWLSSNVYYVDFLPSKLELMDIIHVCGIALLMSFMATIYPAWRASRTQPAEALRYD